MKFRAEKKKSTEKEVAIEETVSEPVAVATAPTVTPVEEPTAEVLVAQETVITPVTTETSHNTAQTVSATTAQFEMATAKSSAKARQAQLAHRGEDRGPAVPAAQRSEPPLDQTYLRRITAPAIPATSAPQH